VNYKLHTDAIQQHLIDDTLPKIEKGYIYANETDLLNIVLYGKTASTWRSENPMLSGNIRDNATFVESAIMANLDSMNSHFIKIE